MSKQITIIKILERIHTGVYTYLSPSSISLLRRSIEKIYIKYFASVNLKVDLEKHLTKGCHLKYCIDG